MPYAVCSRVSGSDDPWLIINQPSSDRSRLTLVFQTRAEAETFIQRECPPGYDAEVIEIEPDNGPHGYHSLPGERFQFGRPH